MSLKNEILHTVSKVKTSFHMPAHKYHDVVNLKIPNIDTTEIPGTDNLHSAFFCIKNAEEHIAKIYNAKRSRIMVAGSSIGLIASIYALSNPNDIILIGRDSHKSVFNACKIANLTYQCVMPTFSVSGVPLDYDNFYELLLQNPSIKLAVLTSPNYYGYIRTFKKIADELDSRGGYLIVDEAHGAHLNFTEYAGYQALEQGAHIVIQSAHKTLPAMTMTAMLHYGNRTNQDAMYRVDEALKMFQSTSPSYPMMISIDDAVSYMEKSKSKVQQKFELFKQIEADFIDKEYCEDASNVIKDPFKIFMNTASIGYTGFEVNDILIEHGIYVEFAQYNGVLLYLSIFNRQEELEECYKILNSLKVGKKISLKSIKYPKLQRITNKYRNMNVKYDIIELVEALGRVAMEDIIVYPPGIPILLKGEEITREVLDSLMNLSDLPVGTIEGKNEKLTKIRVAWC